MVKYHTDREYTAQLSGIRDALLRMSGHVEVMLSDASQALSAGDAQLATKVVARDEAVDQLELEIDGRCVSVLARWQPMASDLRFVTLALKIVTDLERLGDLAVNIAERVPQLREVNFPWSWDRACEMAKLAHCMLGDVMEALVRGDAQLAENVIDQDDQMDALYHLFFQDVLESMRRDPKVMSPGIHGLSIAKWLERAGDHVTNLAEQVIFMVRGEDVRHAQDELKDS